MQNVLPGIISTTLFQAGEFNAEPIVSNAFNTNCLFTLLIIPILLLTIISAIFPGQFLRMLRLTGNYSSAASAFRSSQAGNRTKQVVLAIIAMFSIPTFLLFIELTWGKSIFGLSGLGLWALNTGILTAAILGRYILSILTGSISGTREVFREYLFNISQSYKLLGIILTLINFCISYLDIIPDIWLIITGITVIIILYVFRLIRLVMLFIHRSFYLFYLILYLCALEIAPVLIFVKYLSGQIS